MTLSPATDTWTDKLSPVEVVVNLNGENDAYTIFSDDIANPASVGTQWDEHRLVDKGISIDDSSYTKTEKTYSGTGSGLTEKTVDTTVVDITKTITDTYLQVGLTTEKSAISTLTKDLGTKVVDTSIIPYIRSRVVDFGASRMMPDTKMFASFDGVEASFDKVIDALSSYKKDNKLKYLLLFSTTQSRKEVFEKLAQKLAKKLDWDVYQDRNYILVYKKTLKIHQVD